MGYHGAIWASTGTSFTNRAPSPLHRALRRFPHLSSIKPNEPFRDGWPCRRDPWKRTVRTAAFAGTQCRKNASRPVSRVLYGPCLAAGTWRPFILGACRQAPHATYPGGWAGNSPEGCPSRHPYSVLLPVGFALPRPLPSARWALTPPFHPCRENRGGLLSVALSLGSPPPAVSRHRVSMEPGLSSPAAFRLRGCGRPASWQSV